MTTPEDHKPPDWLRKLLGAFLEPRLLEASLGDLEEKFRIKVLNKTPRWKASILYITEGLGFLKMARRQKSVSRQTTINMIGHTLLFFSRLVRKDKSYYLVSLMGLTICLFSFLLIMMYISDEMAYDKFHEKRDRLYRVATHIRLNDVYYDQATSQFPAAQTLRFELPEVEEAIRVFRQDVTLEYGEKKFDERIIMADENFLDVFTFPIIVGDVKTAMREPASIILTQATAKKYFGPENPIGKTIVIYKHSLTVTAIVRDVPEQSHLKFAAIIPLTLQLNMWKQETGIEGRENKWYWTGTYTYVLLKRHTNLAQVEEKLPLIINKYFPERYRDGGSFELQAIGDIHLKSDLLQEFEPGGSMLYLRLFSIVAFVIIIVSSINLINLSYFKISSRIRELGIRKFLGQNAVRIIAQLSIESVLLGVLAFTFAFLLCSACLSYFNLLVQRDLKLWSPTNMLIAGSTLLLIIAICITAVIRPSIQYAARSANHLLLQNHRNPDRANFRNILVGFQVCFSFVLLVFSFIISGQLTFFKTMDLGFDKKDIVIVNLNEDIWNNVDAFKNELKKSKAVIEVAGGGVPGSGYNGWRFVPEGGSYERPFMFPCDWVDHHYLSTLSIRLLAGRNFHPHEKNDSVWYFIINKRAAVELGWQDDPINRKLEIFAPGTTNIMGKGVVIGLVEDYHFESLHKPVKPIVLTVDPYGGPAIVKISGATPENGITSIGTVWKKFSGKPFEYEMLDKKLERLYNKEDRLSNVILFFTLIALYMTCYGMFAMSSLLFSSRLKEVAIRKVFGADQLAIIKQLYTRYALFNLIAIVFGVPIAFYLGNLWLETFQFRIELSSSLFLKAGAGILLAGLVSVSYYLGRVAYSNPVRFLRRE